MCPNNPYTDLYVYKVIRKRLTKIDRGNQKLVCQSFGPISIGCTEIFL